MGKHTHPPMCSVDGCPRPWYCRGWCKPHYSRWLRRGEPGRAALRGSSATGETPEARFWSLVDKGSASDCWAWTGTHDRNGYGKFQSTGAHRFSWDLHFGPVPEDLYVLHHCDNPPCVNPEHLWVGTHQDNMDDMVAKGRNLNRRRPFYHASSGVFRLPRTSQISA